jgi:hypothetical protein
MKKSLFSSVLVLCFLSFVIITSAIAVPAYINYQGVLRDSAGNLVTGSKDMTFKVYNVLTGGTALWTMTSTGVSVSNGLYTVKLGPIGTELGTGTRWLEVAVGSETLSPRLEILSVAYAITAGTAESLSGFPAGVSGVSIVPTTDATGKLSSSVIPASGIVMDYATLAGSATTAATVSDGAITTAKIAAGAVTTAEIGAGVVTGAKLAGNIAISTSGNITNTGTLTINKLASGSTGTGYCVGTGTIISGDPSVIVSNTAVTGSSIILLTVGHAAAPISSAIAFGGIKISAKTIGTSFTVSTMSNGNAAADIPFGYLIIN